MTNLTNQKRTMNNQLDQISFLCWKELEISLCLNWRPRPKKLRVNSGQFLHDPLLTHFNAML